MPHHRLRRAYSFMGGSLIGISISLPVLILDARNDFAELVLFVSLILASTGIGIHLSGSKRTVQGVRNRSHACASTISTHGIKMCRSPDVAGERSGERPQMPESS